MFSKAPPTALKPLSQGRGRRSSRRDNANTKTEDACPTSIWGKTAQSKGPLAPSDVQDHARNPRHLVLCGVSPKRLPEAIFHHKTSSKASGGGALHSTCLFPCLVFELTHECGGFCLPQAENPNPDPRRRIIIIHRGQQQPNHSLAPRFFLPWRHVHHPPRASLRPCFSSCLSWPTALCFLKQG